MMQLQCYPAVVLMPTILQGQALQLAFADLVAVSLGLIIDFLVLERWSQIYCMPAVEPV